MEAINAETSRIRVLAPEVAGRIAAGEVIERPASIVKELIENALDAGATAIAIEIRNGGLDLVRVSDDGAGIVREDVATAFERFATSKLATVEDLSAIRTLGFRGEALAAIAAVSRVEMVTRARSEVEGTRIVVQEGRSIISPAASPIGCSVTVTDLFANAPARRKFLKSPLREAELCRATVVRYALAYPRIAFRLRVDDRETLVAPPASLIERIAICLGRDIVDEMIPVTWEAADLKVHGLISRPSLGRSDRQAQFFFVNGRPIRSGLLAVALERPYAGRLPLGRHPVGIIFIEISPTAVDVNVHPTKAEVRFMHERSAYWAVAQAVEGALNPFPRQETVDTLRWPFADFATAPYVPLREVGTGYNALSELRAVGQLHQSYILAQSPEGLTIIDPHAAHEAILFERLLRGEPGQEISPPYLLLLTASETEAVSDHLDVFREMGIEVEPFGPETLVVRSLPAPLMHVPVADLIAALAQEIQRHGAAQAGDLREALAMRAACLAAIKAGDILSFDQMQKLVDEVAAYWSPGVCPHGRPAFITLSMDELDRRFLRR